MINNQANTLFDKIDSCLGNCNETYSGNIFLRKIITEQGLLIFKIRLTVRMRVRV
jgi:hypothetical protein